MATAALVVTAVAGVASVVSGRKAAKAQRKQNKVANRIAANKRVRSIKKSIAARRVRQGQIDSAGFQLGVQGGSAVQGASAGLSSDSASSIGASNQQFTGQQAISNLSNTISGHQQDVSTFSGIAGLAAPFTNPQNVAALEATFGGG